MLLVIVKAPLLHDAASVPVKPLVEVEALLLLLWDVPGTVNEQLPLDSACVEHGLVIEVQLALE